MGWDSFLKNFKDYFEVFFFFFWLVCMSMVIIMGSMSDKTAGKTVEQPLWHCTALVVGGE